MSGTERITRKVDWLPVTIMVPDHSTSSRRKWSPTIYRLQALYQQVVVENLIIQSCW